jgi:acyl-coenzyme A thioesterase PaaI-like protein
VTTELPAGWVLDDTSAEEVEQQRAVYEPFTDRLRQLVDLGIRSEVDLDTVLAAQAHVDAAIELLDAQKIEGSYGVRIGDGFGRNWGNAIMGLRNAIAPPLDIQTDGVSRSWADFELGAAYEGPPTMVHGGVLSLVLDHVFGAAAGADHTPHMTGTLTLVYKRPTRLGVPLRAEAWIDRTEGRKSFVVGFVADEDGHTVEAEGIFIQPRRWDLGTDQADRATAPEATS